MPQIVDYVTSYSSSASPGGITWKFTVGPETLFTGQPEHAATMRLAIQTASRVQVNYDPGYNVMTSAKAKFQYTCHERKIVACASGEEKHGKETVLCETLRRAPCENKPDSQ